MKTNCAQLEHTEPTPEEEGRSKRHKDTVEARVDGIMDTVIASGDSFVPISLSKNKCKIALQQWSYECS